MSGTGLRDRAADGWLEAIGRAGWRKATAADAARAAGLTEDALAAAIGDRFDALAAFQDRVAAGAIAGMAGGANVRERLFDGIMQAFDILQAQRPAVEAIIASRDPGVPMLLAGRAGLHVRRLALAAGVDAHGLGGQLRLAALSALGLKALATWRRDGSADMAATMAELDRLLDRAERAATEGVTPDLVGLPGLSGLVSRLQRRGGRADQVPPPSPGPTAE